MLKASSFEQDLDPENLVSPALPSQVDAHLSEIEPVGGSPLHSVPHDLDPIPEVHHRREPNVHLSISQRSGDVAIENRAELAPKIRGEVLRIYRFCAVDGAERLERLGIDQEHTVVVYGMERLQHRRQELAEALPTARRAGCRHR